MPFRHVGTRPHTFWPQRRENSHEKVSVDRRAGRDRAGAAPAEQAYFRGTWCAKLDIGGGVNQERCDFPNFATCRAYVNAQPRSFCVQNQWRAENWGVADDRTEARFNRVYR